MIVEILVLNGAGAKHFVTFQIIADDMVNLCLFIWHRSAIKLLILRFINVM